MPWNMDWSGSTRAPVKERTIPLPVPSKGMGTEVKMIAAAQFTPEENRARDVQMKSPENIAELKAEILRNKSPEGKKILTEELNKLQKSNKISPEGDGESAIRISDEKLPTIPAKKIADSPLSELDKRNEWVGRMSKEYEAAKKGKTRAELDKFASNSWYFAKKEYPEEASIYAHFHNSSSDSPTNTATKSFIDVHGKPVTILGGKYNARGYVYSDKGDRVFLAEDADMNTLVHETEHLRQQADVESMGGKAPHLTALGKSSNPISKLFKLTSENRNDPGIKEVFRANNAYNSGGEYLANLQGYMKATMKEGISWSETPFFKTLVKKAGEKEATTMLLDALMTLQRQEYTKNR